MPGFWNELLAAFQFFTRLPITPLAYSPDLLSRASKFLPMVGLAIGLGAAALFRLTTASAPRSLVVLIILTYLILITGAFHEDALADVADGFGGGWQKEKVLAIMRDSRIGSYGGIAIALSVLWRFVLLSQLPAERFVSYLLVAHVLCRWTTLPLGFFLPPARADGEASSIAQQISRPTLLFGTSIAIVPVIYLLRQNAWLPILVAIVITAASGLYYRARIAGVTGDCFGATNQLTEIGIYVCGCLAS